MIRIRKDNDERYVSLGAFEEMYKQMGFYIVDENKKKPVVKEAEFEEKSVVFDKSLNGFFVKRESFEKAKIGEVHRLPKYIMNKPVVGNVFLQNGFSAGNPKFFDKDEYYFLPCKEG